MFSPRLAGIGASGIAAAFNGAFVTLVDAFVTEELLQNLQVGRNSGHDCWKLDEPTGKPINANPAASIAHTVCIFYFKNIYIYKCVYLYIHYIYIIGTPIVEEISCENLLFETMLESIPGAFQV